LVLDQLTENHSDYFACIRYHVNWPSENDPFYLYNPAENGNRTGYYSVSGVPHMQVDGVVDAGGSSSYWSVIQSRYAIDSPLDIELSGTYNESSRLGTLNVTVTATDDITLEGLFLRIALVESDIYWHAPNGAYWHHQTMRHMFPYSLGTRIYISEEGEVIQRSEAISCPDPIVPENSELIVFVQAHGSRDILQAARIPIADLTPVSVDETGNSLPLKFELAQNYPNPFNANTTISYTLTNDGQISLAVYDLAGRKVANLFNGNQSAGNYQIVWDGTDNSGQVASSGIYFYRLIANGQSSTRRMMLLK